MASRSVKPEEEDFLKRVKMGDMGSSGCEHIIGLERCCSHSPSRKSYPVTYDRTDCWNIPAENNTLVAGRRGTEADSLIRA